MYKGDEILNSYEDAVNYPSTTVYDSLAAGPFDRDEEEDEDWEEDDDDEDAEEDESDIGDEDDEEDDEDVEPELGGDLPADVLWNDDPYAD